jgi:peptidoglycan/LPS O-acetylase OafA/YrhL
MLFHSRVPESAHTPTAIRDLLSHGYDSVIFFFLLSGFVLTYSHRQSQGFYSKGGIRRYYLSRFMRIYPVYFIGLALALPLSPLFWYGTFVRKAIDRQMLLGLVLVPTFLQAWYPPAALAWNSPAWSLSVEIAFYATLPLIIKRLSPKPAWMQIAFAAALLVFVELFRDWLVSTFFPMIHLSLSAKVENNFSSYFPLFFAPVFILGSGLACLYVTYPPSVRTANILFQGSMALMLVLFCLTSKLPSWVLSRTVLVILFSAIIMGATTSNCLIARLLSSKSLVLLGDSSYALYILHIPLAFWWWMLYDVKLHYFLSSAVATLFFWLVAVALSVGCYRYIEAPLVHWCAIKLGKSPKT